MSTKTIKLTKEQFEQKLRQMVKEQLKKEDSASRAIKSFQSSSEEKEDSRDTSMRELVDLVTHWINDIRALSKHNSFQVERLLDEHDLSGSKAGEDFYKADHMLDEATGMFRTFLANLKSEQRRLKH